MNSLKNKIIISMPTMKDYFFEKSIVYISDHGINGATGFILNKKIDTPKFKKLFRTKFLINIFLWYLNFVFGLNFIIFILLC